MTGTMQSRALKYAEGWSNGKRVDAVTAINPKFVTGEADLYQQACRSTVGRMVIYRGWVIFCASNGLHPPVFVRDRGIVLLDGKSVAVKTDLEFQVVATVVEEPETSRHRGFMVTSGIFCLSTRRNPKFPKNHQHDPDQ